MIEFLFGIAFAVFLGLILLMALLTLSMVLLALFSLLGVIGNRSRGK